MILESAAEGLNRCLWVQTWILLFLIILLVYTSFGIFSIFWLVSAQSFLSFRFICLAVLKYYIDLCKGDVHSVFGAMIKPGTFYVHTMQINHHCLTCFCACWVVEVQGTENPLAKRPAIDARFWQESARKQHLNDRKTKMKISQLEDPQTQGVSQVRIFFFFTFMECWFTKI